MTGGSHGDTLAASLLGDGWLVRGDVVPPPVVTLLREGVDEAVEQDRRYHGTSDHHWHNRVLFLPQYGGVFSDVLADDAIFGAVDPVLGEDSIVYTMTTSCLPPGGDNTTSALHVDLPRIVPNYLLGVVVVIVLDHFDGRSGGTLVLPRSQERQYPPSEAEFRESAVRIEAEPGSAIYMHPRIWHRSSLNRTSRPRRAVLVMMVRSWMKQRFDVARMIPSDVVETLQPAARRRLGFDSLPPGSYDEFYGNAGRDTYRKS